MSAKTRRCYLIDIAKQNKPCTCPGKDCWWDYLLRVWLKFKEKLEVFKLADHHSISESAATRRWLKYKEPKQQ